MEDATLEDFVDGDWNGQMLLQSILYGTTFGHKITPNMGGWEL